VIASRRLRPAVFLDRDGTIIHDANYIARPEQVALVPGAAAAIRDLNRAGIPVIVVTNQSGIARGILTVADYDRVQAEMQRVLKREGAHIDATYYCPHHPDFTGPCDCRKPGTLLYRQAAEDHGIDLARSFYIGDRWRDVAPALVLGGTGVLVPSVSTPPEERERAARDASVVDSLDTVVAQVVDVRR
jgi:D-glycero-D-manno-heptose 1,7-bisphosphate phosphatase